MSEGGGVCVCVYNMYVCEREECVCVCEWMSAPRSDITECTALGETTDLGVNEALDVEARGAGLQRSPWCRRARRWVHCRLARRITHRDVQDPRLSNPTCVREGGGGGNDGYV